MQSEKDDRWLTRREAADYLHVPKRTLDNWAIGRGPYIPLYRLNKGKVLYKKSDLDKLIAESAVLPKFLK